MVQESGLSEMGDFGKKGQNIKIVSSEKKSNEKRGKRR
jgi:hypothetical protein